MSCICLKIKEKWWSTETFWVLKEVNGKSSRVFFDHRFIEWTSFAVFESFYLLDQRCTQSQVRSRIQTTLIFIPLWNLKNDGSITSRFRRKYWALTRPLRVLGMFFRFQFNIKRLPEHVIDFIRQFEEYMSEEM